MNFLRQKFKRESTAVPHASGIVDGDSAVNRVLLSDNKDGDKSKRRSYFMMRTSSSPLLRRRDTPGPPPPAVLADTPAVVAVVPLADSSAPRIQRRRSIPGVAYLVAAKLGVASKSAADDTSMAATLTVPERAVVHSSCHAVLPLICKSAEHVAASDMSPTRRVSDCSSSTASSGSSSSSSGEDNSGGDSDDTLAPAEAPDSGAEAEAGPDSNLPDVVTLTGGDGSGTSSVRSYYSCSAAQPVYDAPLPTVPNERIIESLLTSDTQSSKVADPMTDSERPQPRPQRRQLRLGRWRTASISIPQHSDSDNGIGKLTALAMRPARLSLGSGPSQQQIRQLCGGKVSSEDSGQAAVTGTRKVQRLLSSLSHTPTNLGLNLGGGHSSETQRPHVAHRKLSGALGKLLLAPPPPSATEQAKMDAWTADDDEFSASEYDLSGTYFELKPTSKQAAIDAATNALMAAAGRRKHSSAECTTPESRLSSTSTVVDEGAAALGPEQYKRIFVSSARKLQLQCGRRGMSCVVHIKTMMTKASEHYVVVSGGRNLDAYRISRQILAELCLGEGSDDSGKERPVQHQQPTMAYPARRRSVGSNYQAQRRARRAGAGKECESRPSVASGGSSRDSVVEVPLSSPPPLSPSAEIADAALAKIATAAEEAELAEYGMGDLVSLGPIMASSSDNEDEAQNRRANYRRYRRRRASKWGRLDSAGSQSAVAGAIAAL